LSEGSARRRVSELDLLRGLVLCFIFVYHVPCNLFERFTPKNFGFSDSAEAFVFLSGVSLALAYGPRFASGRAWEGVQSLKRRVAKLYGLHILLSFAAVAIYAAGADFGQDTTLMSEHGRDLFVDDPWAALAGLVTLGHQLGYFNILPLYIVLIAFLVAQLTLLRLGVGPMVAVSGAVYGLARVFDWNIPTWPMKGTWFFNPLAWQLLMALGVAAVVLHRRNALPRLPRLAAVAALVVVVSAFVVTDGFTLLPGLQDQLRSGLDLDKSSLGLGRLAHFMALAYLVYCIDLSRLSERSSLGGPLRLLGRNSLSVFATLSILAAIGQVATTLGGNTPLLDCLVVSGGLTLLFAAARTLETRHAGLVASARLRAEQR
jgi:hypothetical protein